MKNARINDVLLALRRFIGVPIPHTRLRMRGFVGEGEGLRLRLEDPERRHVMLTLPTRRPNEAVPIATWWYVGTLRHAAQWAETNGRLSSEGHEAKVLDGETLIADGVIPAASETTTDDSLDYVIGDLLADPAWPNRHSPAPELYQLIGFDLMTEERVRAYLELPYSPRTIGIDLAVVDEETGMPRSTGWWASTKLNAILTPDEPTALAAHLVPDAEDPNCDAVYDLTHWA
ncbi:hypothetical protein [Streptomyces sp. TP-A0356]|uniref:hypothetical protein n=1 Tax=Streptomyces sp. TP-A0356 TaxID=1359208 RepID=UPI0006E1B31F|nr:hypothetical protein [Streptomyces sp. TP-A0356]